MVSGQKKIQKVDLEKIARQLAKIKITPVSGDEHHVLRATATFATRSFTAGLYTVSVGLRQALLLLDHPGYEIEHAYQATLAKDTWSESWKSSNKSHIGGQVELSIGAKMLEAVGFSAKARVAKDREESTEATTNAPYPIVTVIPIGWRIGTELGDPRDPQGALPDGLDHCLNGEYLSGRNGEHGDGFTEKDGRFALCELLVKPHANDPHITATLFGSTNSLKIAVERSKTSDEEPQKLSGQRERKEHEEELRKAFIEICLQRAKDAFKDSTRSDAMVSGDFYLSHHEVHGPKTPSKASENYVQSGDIRDEQASTSKTKS